MARKYYTFLIVPQNNGSVRKVRISAALLKFTAFTVTILLVSFVCLSWDYARVAGETSELTELRQLAAEQARQLDVLAGKVVHFEQRMLDLKQFDEKIRTITNLEGGAEAGLGGMGGPVSDESFLESRLAEEDRALFDKIHANIDQLLEEVEYQEQSFRELWEFLKQKQSILASTPSIWPVMGWVTSEFGYRVSPFTGRRELHRGIDIAARLGKEVVAPADGKVTAVKRENDIGNVVWIQHTNGITTCYGHLLKTAVKKGQKIKRGEIVGYVGNSGRSTGPHLHYGVQLNGVYVNPRKYIF